MFNLKLWDRAKSSPIVESEKANSYMWLYASGADSLNGNIPDSVIPNIVLYDYHNSRAERAIKPFVIGRNYVQFPVMCSNPPLLYRPR